MSQGLSLNLRMAKEAVDYVARRLPIGPANRPGAQPDAGACVRHVRETMVCTADFIPHLAERALENGCGNCGEQAAVAFMFLVRKGARPVDYFNLYDGNGEAIHSFVAIGFAGDSGHGQSTIGEEAAVCDPWDEVKVYPMWQINQKMSLWASGATIRSLRRDT